MKHIVGIALFLSYSAMGQMPYQFSRLELDQTGIDFMNEIVEDDQLNYFLEDDLYNGAGLAVGDINNDGLDDLYFVSNFGEDQLYLNEGNFNFKNITESAFEKPYAGIWKTAACMVDLNADGFLDIYVCRRGNRLETEEERRNLVFINTGENSFVELGKEIGLDDPGRSSDAAFFDFDQDGDLDAFITNRKQNTSVMEQYLQQFRKERAHSNRLYRNVDGQFEDITSFELGVAAFGFCFDASIADVDGDGWPDLYVTNDYDLPDYLLINNQNGGFEDEIDKRMRHTSHYSMGSDMADFNNDGLIDLVVLDMSNQDYEKSKTNMGSMSTAEFWDRIKRGYPYQYMYNSLQLNLGQGYFSEIAHLSGIASTDWSWAPLIADFDQDGFKDLFVTNGYWRDVRDQDFTRKLKAYISSNPEGFEIDSMLQQIPQTKEVNYFYRNKGDLTFSDVTSAWGMDFGSVSHGSAYSDLDNDGDLDLIVNTLNEPPLILKNNSNQKNYLKIKLKGPSKNRFAIGARIEIQSELGIQVQEIYPSRGYGSSSSYQICFGLGNDEQIKSLTISWNAKEMTELKNISTNQTLEINYETAERKARVILPVFEKEENVFVQVNEAPFDDYEREVLIPHKMSQLGPFLSSGDVNGDQRKDIFIGGGVGSPSRIILNKKEGMLFKPYPVFSEDAAFEDGESLFFDADGDGDEDLYVVSGGNEYPAGDVHYQDRLYINENGRLKRDSTALPEIRSSGQCVVPNDFDGDGDIDLFVGGRQVAGAYPKSPRSYWLVNENGRFSDQIETIAPTLKEAGMITDVVFSDINGDGEKDLIVVGEWMTIQLFIHEGRTFKRQTETIGSDALHGWWNCIEMVDLDKDGVDEILLGNLGLNNKFHPTKAQPLRIYLEDFDDNGELDIVLSKSFDGVEHPVRGKECLTDQIPMVSEKFKSYHAFAQADFKQLFQTKERPLFANQFASGYLKLIDGQWKFIPFPKMAQMGPVNKIIPANINGDEWPDIILFGNRYEAEIETPRYDGNPGLVLLGSSNGKFTAFPLELGGGFANKNAKDAIVIDRTIYISNSAESINRVDLMYE